jgi:hypothetical protein
MLLHLLTAAAFSLGAAFALGTPAISADLPQEGSFTTHSPGTYNAHATQVGDKHFIISGTSPLIMYNDAGSGPLCSGYMIALNDLTIG